MPQALTQEFVNNCRIEDGFHLRGEAMTRTEVFVDAAFAFAVTMLVISIDQIPQSVPELIAVSTVLSISLVTVLSTLRTFLSIDFSIDLEIMLPKSKAITGEAVTNIIPTNEIKISDIFCLIFIKLTPCLINYSNYKNN